MKTSEIRSWEWFELEQWDGYIALSEDFDQRDYCEKCTAQDILDHLYWWALGDDEGYCSDDRPHGYPYDLPWCGECDRCRGWLEWEWFELWKWDGYTPEFELNGETRGTSEFRRARRKYRR